MRKGGFDERENKGVGCTALGAISARVSDSPEVTS